MKETSEDIEKQIVYLKQAIEAEKMMQKKFVLIPRQLNNSKRKIKTYQNDINKYTMKLKKGSKAAKDFMAKIRSMKNKPKKSKVGAVKRSTRKVFKKNTSVLSGTHTGTKSHNYKISISGVGNEVFKDYIKQVETEIKGQSLWFKKLKTYYKKPTEFNDVCFALKYKAKKVQEIVNELQTKYNFNR